MMKSFEPVLEEFHLESQWQTADPFLFCAFHKDDYPKSNGKFGPIESLTGRNLGQDFDPKLSYRMYHGTEVPGFPLHPHRGFETITLVRQGYVDHADSLGAGGRYGAGDVQWMTAGAGIQHSEMFPLLSESKPNPLVLLQLWINLPKSSKLVKAGYKMFWSEDIPQAELNEKKVKVELICGDGFDLQAAQPPQYSWAADPENEVCIWIISMKPNSELTLPGSKNMVNRTLYSFEGDGIQIAEKSYSNLTGLSLLSTQETKIKNLSQSNTILLLQGKAIAEPIAQYGPFVMNTQAEIAQALSDYQKTNFGGWPWESDAVVHGDRQARFARFHDGREEFPSSKRTTE